MEKTTDTLAQLKAKATAMDTRLLVSQQKKKENSLSAQNLNFHLSAGSRIFKLLLPALGGW